MSALALSGPFQPPLRMSAFEGKVDRPFCTAMSAFGPKRILRTKSAREDLITGTMCGGHVTAPKNL